MKARQPVQLGRGLSRAQLAAIGIGSMMGMAWVTLLGPLLGGAGPAGAVAGFLIGGIIMLLTAFCYAELITAMPSAGGEVLYAHEIFGPGVAFTLGWFLLLMAISITTFEAVSLAWLLNKLFPGLEGPALYTIAGESVGIGSLAIGLVGMVGVAIVNLLGANSAGRLQLGFTMLKATAVALFIIAGISQGSIDNLEPLLVPAAGGSPLYGILWIVATAPFWHGGFQVVAQAVEERRADVTVIHVARTTIFTVIFSMAFYSAVVIAASMSTPWRSLVSADMPAAIAMRAAFGSDILAKACLLAAVLGLLATWNGCLIWSARLFLALGRARLLPTALAAVHPRYGSPHIAVLTVALLGIPGIFLGRTAFLPIVNTAAASLAAGFCMTCIAVIRLRTQQPDMPRPYRLPGGIVTAWIAALGTAAMMIYIFIEPLLHHPDQIPLEWILLSLWGCAGLLFWIQGANRRPTLDKAQRRAALLGYPSAD